MINMESRDAEDVSNKLADANLKIWKKVEDIAFVKGKHPDEIYADFSDRL